VKYAGYAWENCGRASTESGVKPPHSTKGAQPGVDTPLEHDCWLAWAEKSYCWIWLGVVDAGKAAAGLPHSTKGTELSLR